MNEFLSLFTRASKLMREAADDAMRQHGVRVGQNLVLEVLWESDGLSPGELADRLHVATPTVVKSATRMEASGLLTRRRDTTDARLVRLYLTEHARSVRSAIESEREALAQRATAALTAEEERTLVSALAKIVDEFSDTTAVDEPRAETPPPPI
jgi:MarR family transcriptional regulator, organic hydroperoxide resistance regulator